MSSNKDLSTLAKNIRRLRGKKNISQDKLSKLAGIAHNTIIKIETGLIKNPQNRNRPEHCRRFWYFVGRVDKVVLLKVYGGGKI